MIGKINLNFLAAIAVTALILSGCGLNKMVKKYPEVKYEVQPEVLETHGGKVDVAMKGTFPEKYFHKKAVVTFEPYLEYPGGTKNLKPYTVKGEKALGDGTVISKTTGGSFSYNDSFIYDPAMNESELKAKVTAKLKKKEVVLGTTKLADGLIYTAVRIKHDEDLLVADEPTAKMLGMDMSEYYEKETIVNGKANLYFVVDRDDLNMKYALNKDSMAIKELDAFKAFLDKGWKIKDITVNAWASPEGEESRNQGLSERRAATGKKYLDSWFNERMKKEAKAKKVKVNTLEKPYSEMASNAKGEDWDGFMNAVQASGINDKNAILNVVRSQQDLKVREQEIRNMSLIYKEVEEQILPPLRRSEFVVNCYMPKKTDEEIARLSTSAPDSLDSKELLYAASLTKDDNTKLQIYKSLVKYYPEDWKGYANVGSLSLKMSNLDDAASYLDKANTLSPNNPIILNNLGSLASKNNDFAAAKTFYSQAQGKRVDVNYNSGILKIVDGDYTGALNLFGNKTCNYNVALAQALTKNLSGATQNLKCAKEDAQVFYLLAIIGARNNDTALLYDNLKKAIAADNSYKAQAAKDREFLKYFGNDEFKNIVK